MKIVPKMSRRRPACLTWPALNKSKLLDCRLAVARLYVVTCSGEISGQPPTGCETVGGEMIVGVARS